MLNTNIPQSNPILPLLFLNAEPEEINSDYLDMMNFNYDDIKQMPVYECGGGSEIRQIGTRCLRSSTTRKQGVSGTNADYKNAIDDSQTAK